MPESTKTRPATVPDPRAALERAKTALANAAELAKERGFPEWADTLSGHALAMDVALSCECGGSGELPSDWPCICDIAKVQCGVTVERLPISSEFAEARSIIRRMLEDWPYQPPEVVEPERKAIAAWLSGSGA